MSAPLLEVTGLTKTFGGLHAVADVDVAVGADEFVALVGPNGAGKSTLLEMAAGGLRPTAGTVRFRGEDITRWPTWRRARAGLVRTFQANRMLADETVRAHLELAVQAARYPGVGRAVARALRPGASLSGAAAEHAARFDLDGVLDARADELPFGQQRLLSIAMSVVATTRFPALLLLDEPLAGMSEAETVAALEMLATVRAAGFSIVMVEHNMSAVMRAAQRVYVLDRGRLLAAGTPAEIVANEAVVEAYLGSEAVEVHDA